ncbi:MAG: J domain-containing protein [Leptolyngbyaceae cyanobacterium]
MTSPYDLLGISPAATPAEVKAAYHAKLKQFPAHTHPKEFKEIRAAYDTLRKTASTEADDFFFLLRPLESKFDPEVVEKLRQRLISQLEVSLEDLIRETF